MSSNIYADIEELIDNTFASVRDLLERATKCDADKRIIDAIYHIRDAVENVPLFDANGNVED